MTAVLQKFKKSSAFTGFVLFIIIVVANSVLMGVNDSLTSGGNFMNGFLSFFGIKNINLIFAKNAPLILITMAQGLLMLVGCMDISVGMQLSLANVVAIMLPRYFEGFPLWASWGLGFLAVVAIATFNGVLIAWVRIPPMLSGFSMMYIIKGINVLIMPKPQGSVPEVIYKTYDKAFIGVPFTVWVVAIAFVFWLILKRTRLAKHMYAVGGHERNAYVTGINSVSVRIRTFIMAGVLTGIGGLCYTAMSGSGDPLSSESYGLKSVSAAILGGISLAGGWGTLSCAIFGALFLVCVQNSIYQMFVILSKAIPGFAVTTYWQNVVSDTIILLGLLATVLTTRAQRAQFKEGVTKMVKGGEKLGEQ